MSSVQINPHCFLARYGVFERGLTPCDGRLVRVHLIPKYELKKKAAWYAGTLHLNDPRVWVWACGGLVGNAGHHGALDSAKTIRLPRSVIPACTENFALDYELDWWLDREYGPRR